MISIIAMQLFTLKIGVVYSVQVVITLNDLFGFVGLLFYPQMISISNLQKLNQYQARAVLNWYYVALVRCVAQALMYVRYSI
ncbi:hypothetical protein BFW38_09010 [Terasakiispira papahanaumokuakeensis]|uniref:Uncharacterized protein n=1 Tax=Terasakiispira papahanaumokuakeensis TaxID=197479 RepID=A0A1E2V9R0_9GAMM|nr:hypothetical protein BFW38_09010 [Terasakiispira papahanaumokuakeensis]